MRIMIFICTLAISTLGHAGLVSIQDLLDPQQRLQLTELAAAQTADHQVCTRPSVKQGANGKAIVGEYIETSFSSPTPYQGSDSSRGEIVWETTIHHPGATYIAPYFKSMRLGEGDTLVVRSPDNSRTWTYRDNGPRNLGDLGGFWGIHIHGDTAILELHSRNRQGGQGVVVGRYARGYTLAETHGETESLCTADDSREAKCYQNTQPEMYNQARAVARLVQNGNAHCTGWLVGTEGHLMTNEHCITSQAQANNITIEFMAEGPDCATNCASALGCPGTIEATAPLLIKDNAPLDYALILPENPVNNLPDTYGFMQLRESGAVVGENLYIPQHPAGWGKRIAYESTYPGDPSGFGTVVSVSEPACSGGTADVGYWLDTQGGSSGSPVLALDDHRVVALHHCRSTPGCASGGAGEAPNRGVPIQDVIADLGADLPNGATCDAPDQPTAVQAIALVDNEIAISWTEAVGGVYEYEVHRSIGDCSSNNYELIASGVTGGSYTDTTVSGGTEYAYRVRTIEPIESCRSDFSECSATTATGLCTMAPSFAGLTSASNQKQNECGIQLDWQAATANCGTGASFNVYRSDTAGFTPSPSTLIDSCVNAATYVDQDIDEATIYHYIVRSEDDSTNGSGLCAGGNEDQNTLIQMALATGPDAVAHEDDLEGGTPGQPVAGWSTYAGPGSASGDPWTLIDSNANSGTNSFFVSDQNFTKDQVLQFDAAVQGALGATLEFSHRYNTEATWDGGALEYSTDGGSTWFDILAGNGGAVAANPDRILQGGYDGPLGAGPLSGRATWNGDNGGWEQVQVALDDFDGMTVQFRWRMSCDGSVADEGWYVDDIRVSSPTACLSLGGATIFSDGFE